MLDDGSDRLLHEVPIGAAKPAQVPVEAAEEGLFGGDKSQAWRWRIDITNNKNIPVSVRIEDSLPRIEDKRIKLVDSSTGKENQEELLTTWSIDLPPGAKKSVEYGYKFKYPADMQVDLGLV